MKHHLLGPSVLPRVVNCIGSLYGPPVEDRSSDAAEEGTTCHSLLEWCLAFSADPRDLLGTTEFNPKFPVTIEMVEAVELFLDTVKSITAEFGLDRTSVMSEVKLVHPVIPNELFGGTSDCIIFGNNTLIVMDLKYGRRQVFANSVQLTAYSLLALANHRGEPVNKVVQVIVQPRGNPNVDRHEPGQDELAEVWAKISEVAAFVQANPDMMTPRPDQTKAGEWCKYCKRREGCEARLQLATEFRDVAVMPVPNEGGGLKYISAPTSDITTEQLVDWVSKFDVISDFMKDVKIELTKRAGRGEKIPGHKLLVKFGNRNWVESDEEKMRKKLPRLGLGLSAKDVTTQKLLSVAQVEKLLKEKGNWGDVKDKFATLYESKPNGVKLANEKAKGIEVQPEALEELLLNINKEMNDE
jgi:hypothetical protein